MKFRTSFQVSRSNSKDNGSRPATSVHWKIPGLRERQSKPSGLNNTSGATHGGPKKDELSLASPSTGVQEQEDPMASPDVTQSLAAVDSNGGNKSQEPQLKRSVTRKKAMHDWMQKTGAQLRTQSASLKARGQKLSEGMRANRKSKVVRTG